MDIFITGQNNDMHEPKLVRGTNKLLYVEHHIGDLYLIAFSIPRTDIKQTNVW